MRDLATSLTPHRERPAPDGVGLSASASSARRPRCRRWRLSAARVCQRRPGIQRLPSPGKRTGESEVIPRPRSPRRPRAPSAPGTAPASRGIRWLLALRTVHVRTPAVRRTPAPPRCGRRPHRLTTVRAATQSDRARDLQRIGRTWAPADRRPAVRSAPPLRPGSSWPWVVRPSYMVGITPRTAELFVGELAHVLDRLEQLPDASLAECLTLQRHQDDFGRREAVDGQHPEGGWAVDEDDVIVRREPAASARASTCSRPVRLSRCTSAPARSMVAGTTLSPSTPGT